MGQQTSHAQDEQLKALMDSSKLGESQLRAALKGFKKAGTGKAAHISRAEFVEVLRQGGIASKLLASQFWKIVAKKAEEMSIEDFVTALALVSRGDSAQRLGLTFDLLDVDEDGFVSKQEMTDVLKEVHALCGQLVGYSGRVYNSANEFVDSFFAEFDREKTSKISRQAYINGAYKSLEIISTLCLYGSALPMDSAPATYSPEYGPKLPDSIII